MLYCTVLYVLGQGGEGEEKKRGLLYSSIVKKRVSRRMGEIGNSSCSWSVRPTIKKKEKERKKKKQVGDLSEREKGEGRNVKERESKEREGREEWIIIYSSRSVRTTTAAAALHQ